MRSSNKNPPQQEIDSWNQISLVVNFIISFVVTNLERSNNKRPDQPEKDTYVNYPKVNSKRMRISEVKNPPRQNLTVGSKIKTHVKTQKIIHEYLKIKPWFSAIMDKNCTEY